MREFKASGKLLITGEYLVLHGAQALALPLTKMFQTLSVIPARNFSWKAFDEKNQLWLQTDKIQDDLLGSILKYIKSEKPHLFEKDLAFETRMNFSPRWGLGSSSTFISLLSQWSGIDVFKLQARFFKGSGYDVAAATQKKPFLYQLTDDLPRVEVVHWDPHFKDNLRFVYLGKKQDTREAMSYFKAKIKHPNPQLIQSINRITHNLLQAPTLGEFQKAMLQHETILSELLAITPVKVQRFKDFPGEIKSLGGWGGDFVLTASAEDSDEYFHSKSHDIIFKWSDLIF